MGQNRSFDIAFVGLTHGIHEFNYRIEDKFFVDFGAQDFSNCDTNIKLVLDKHTGFMQLQFDVDGNIETICDRCGNAISVQLWDEFKLIIKLVDDSDTMNSQEEDPDIYYIDRNESHLSVATWIYEFIILSIPLQHVCKENEKGESTCNQKALEALSKLKGAPIDVLDTNIWKGLDQFKQFDTDVEDSNAADVEGN